MTRDDLSAALASAEATVETLRRALAEMDGQAPTSNATPHPAPDDEWVDSGTAAQITGASKQSCRRWANRGLVVGGYSPSGTRLYLKSSLMKMRQPI